MFPERVFEEWVGKRVQLVSVREGEPRTVIVQGYDEFGIVVENEGGYFPTA